MRILYTTPTFLPATNGLVTRLRSTLRVLREQGDDVMVVAPLLPEMPQYAEGFPILGLPSGPLPMYAGYRVSLPYAAPPILQRIAEFQPEMIHAIDPVAGTGWFAHRVAQRHSIPLVTSYHTNVAFYLKFYGCGWLESALWSYLRHMHRGAALTLCPSVETRSTLQQHGIAAQELWPGGVDVDRFHPAKRDQMWRRRLLNGSSEETNTTILLYVGRVAPEKQIEHLLQVLPSLDHCHLAIVGDGPSLGHLQAMAACLPVSFLGRLDADDLACAYRAADIFCLPSETETFGNVTLEAMASGLPVVAAAAGGTLDVLTHEHTGLLYPPGQLEGLKQVLRHLCLDSQLRVRLGAAARREAMHKSWHQVTLSLKQQYHAMLSSPSLSSSLLEAEQRVEVHG